MAIEMLRDPRIFYGLSHMKAQFMVSARFVFANSFLVSIERNDLYLTFKSKKSTVFHIFKYCYSKHRPATAKHVDDNDLFVVI